MKIGLEQRSKNGILLRFQNSNIQNRGQLDLHEISPQIPRNSDKRINVDGLDRTHRPCARRGAHPRESREKKSRMGRLGVACAAAAVSCVAAIHSCYCFDVLVFAEEEGEHRWGRLFCT
uniref:Uncharacterized protein n=1 Tax=Solanum tuberosum TaxID=4113 RepID=M1BP61_SOLTU